MTKRNIQSTVKLMFLTSWRTRNVDDVFMLSSVQMLKEAAPEMNASSSETEEEKEEHPKVDGERDPDFSQVRPSVLSSWLVL